jgi:anaerobic ribonucleoside-triphosphate reductase
MALKTCEICGNTFNAVTSERHCKDCKQAHKSMYAREWSYIQGNAELKAVRRAKRAFIKKLESAAEL